MKSLRDLAVAGKRVLLRVDFNVPMDDAGRISDDTRITMVLPTIRQLLAAGARLIVCSHMGRPKGKVVASLSLAPVAAHLQALLGVPVTMAPDCVGAEVSAMAAQLQPGQVLLLENLRFHAEETANDADFSAQLASLAEVYVNDAFAASHRAHASVVGVAERVAETAAGLLLEKEMDYFRKSMAEPVRPLVAVIGGAKVSTKLAALENMLGKVDRMIIGGAMANTFLKSLGVAVGASKVEEDLLDTARRFTEAAAARGMKLYLPVDFIVADRFAADAVVKTVPAQDIPEGWMALDIGPASSLLFGEVIDWAGTIIWNGPMGAFEMDAFARGTMDLCRRVGASPALSIIGGGDSNAALKKSGEEKNVSYMSSGGGAFLELLEGKTLPGVAVLDRE
jgi:phosphoglycerate kinase